MKCIINFAAGHRSLVLAILALFTALSATQLSRLHITISAESMLEKGTPGSLGTVGVANVTKNFGADSAWTNPAGMTGVTQDHAIARVQLF